MKTISVKTDELRTNAKSFRLQNNDVSVDVYQYSLNDFNSHEMVVEISSPIIEENNYHLLLVHNHLKMIVSEVKEINKPFSVHHLKKQMFEKEFYERLRTFSINLSNKSFYIKESFYNADRHLIKVVLKQHLN